MARPKPKTAGFKPRESVIQKLKKRAASLRMKLVRVSQERMHSRREKRVLLRNLEQVKVELAQAKKKQVPAKSKAA